jgi:signal peptidase I
MKSLLLLLKEQVEGSGYGKNRKVVWEYVQSVLLAIVLALFIITFVVQSFIVTGPSMEPTLYSGERLLINKFIFRFTEPLGGILWYFTLRLGLGRIT